MAKILRNAAASFLIFAFGSEIAWRLWRRYSTLREIENRNKLTIDVLMYSVDNARCREHTMKLTPCDRSQCPAANIRKLIKLFDDAEKTLNVCVYMLTYKEITDAIIRAYNRDVDIRVITDLGMSNTEACSTQIARLEKAGVKVLLFSSEVSLMHHKFVVADEKILAFGSANFTAQAFSANFDSTVITNQENLVAIFNTEFKRLWKMVDQAVNHRK